MAELAARGRGDAGAGKFEPLRKLIELFTYITLLLRARINDAARATMLATATGADLDNLAALLGVARLVLDAGDPSATPPIAATMEADDALRQRAQLALEGYTTAGSVGAYEFHARSADGRVSDVSVISPSPGDVLVTVLSTEGDGTASPELTDIVSQAVNAEEVRPLCDSVSVSAATILHYNVEATLEIAEGPDAGVVEAARKTRSRAIARLCMPWGRPSRSRDCCAPCTKPGSSAPRSCPDSRHRGRGDRGPALWHHHQSRVRWSDDDPATKFNSP